MHVCNKAGYGLIKSGPKGRRVLAHRVSYIVHKGEIPPGKIVRHSCDQPCCVNPEHLSLGTPADNANDRSRRKRGSRRDGENHHYRKLSALQVLAIRTDARAKHLVAQEYGISPDHIVRIRNRKYWKLV